MNKTVFKTQKNVNYPAATSYRNEAGGLAYRLEDRAALAQLLVTNCFNNTFYSSADDLAKQFNELCNKVDSEFLAKACVYGAENGRMKDSVSFGCAVLANRGPEGLYYLSQIFERVMNTKRLYGFVQIIRSGVTGRRSFGSAVKRLIQNWINNRDGEGLFKGSIGHSNPSLSDVIKMVRPRPENREREALYAYLIGKECKSRLLPPLVQEFERFKVNPVGTVPAVPFQALSNIKLSTSQWEQLALSMPWNTLRMNLNTLERNGVFNNRSVVRQLAAKLASKDEVARNNVFPYQLMTAYKFAENVPSEINVALQDAVELSTYNVPSYDCDVAVMVDTSGSMSSPVTGNRLGSTSKFTCVELASLIASTVLRKNPGSKIIPFDTQVHSCKFNPRDSLITNASTLARFGGGGTDCSCALRSLNVSRDWKYDLLFMISDNESWASLNSGYRGYSYGRGSYPDMAHEWSVYRKANPKAKMVLLDIQPNTSTQVQSDKNVLNCGGWSDVAFEIVGAFLKGEKDSFVTAINNVNL